MAIHTNAAAMAGAHITGVDDYLLGHSEHELDRIERQSAFIAGLTYELLRRAGLCEGMHVLDAGCGTGEAALLAAELVGSTGSVTAVDCDPAGFAQGEDHAAEAGFSNITFETAELHAYDPGRGFDAVIGRFVLMHAPYPTLLFKRLVEHVRPGGIAVFQEVALSRAYSMPPVASYDDKIGPMCAAFERAGRHPDMGASLDCVFRDCGLVPELFTGVATEGNGEGFIPAWLAETLETMVPLMERTGVARASELGLSTLEQRVRAEARRKRALLVGPLVVGAWATV